MDIPSEVYPKELIGRQIYFRSLRDSIIRSIRKGQAPPPAAFGPKPKREISADRLDWLSVKEMTAIGDAICRQGHKKKQFDPKVRFRGWLRFAAEKVQRKGWRVKSSPAEGEAANPCHADICMPKLDSDEGLSADDLWSRHINRLCVSLTGDCSWLDRHGQPPEI